MKRCGLFALSVLLVDCDFADTPTLVLNEVAPLEKDGDWVEICNPTGEPVGLAGWTLRASGTVVYTFKAGDLARPGKRSVAGPASMSPDIVASFDIPNVTDRIVLSLVTPEVDEVDAIPWKVATTATPIVVVRRCDCAGGVDSPVAVLPIAQATPGLPNSSSLCAGGPPPDGGMPPSDGGGGGCQEAACHPWLPFSALGRTWTFKLTSSTGATGTQVFTTEGPAAAGQYKVHVDTKIGANVRVLHDNVYPCGSGEIRQSVQNAETMITGAPPVKVMIDLTPPPLILPANPKVGDTFTSAFSAGGAQVMESSTVEAEEMVTVPAGTFRTLRVKKKTTAAGQPSEDVYWYACGVGLVKHVGPPPAGAAGATLTHELQSKSF